MRAGATHAVLPLALALALAVAVVGAGAGAGRAWGAGGSRTGPGSTSTTAPVGTGVGPNPSGASLRLASQTSWVAPAAPGNVLDLQVVPRAGSNPATVLDVVVYYRLGNRSQFARSLTAGYHDYVLAHPIHAPLSSFPAAPGGTVDIRLSVGRQLGQLHLSEAGVYPVAVSLEPAHGGPPLARFVTHLVLTTGVVATPKLNVVWVVPFHSPPGDPRTGGVTSHEDAALSALVASLAAHPDVPVTLQATPDTLSGLEVVNPAAVSRLGRALAGREVLAQTWVPMSVPAMLADGLNQQVSLSLTRGDAALSTALGTQPAGRTWVQSGPIDQTTLSFLGGSQFDRVVLPEADLSASPFPTTIAQPFQVAGADQTLIRAAVADAGLASHFTDQPDPVLAAHQLLADLAQIYADAPANQRGVVAVAPASWTPDPGFLDAFLAGLSSSPVLAGRRLDSFFDAVPPAIDDGRPLIRQLVSDQGTIRTQAAGLLPDAQRAARRQLDSLATVLPPNDTRVYPRLERLLLEVPADDLSPVDRQARLGAFAAGLRQVTGQVQLAGSRTITLTARRGQLPLTVVSLSDEPLAVVLEIQSDKLKFPGMTTTGPALIRTTLVKGNNPKIITVEARTSGAFPLHITVLSEDGSLVLAKESFTVQSTALSGVGVVLSVGAALFLVVWWGRHSWRTRRDTLAGERTRRRHARRRTGHGRGHTTSGGLVTSRSRAGTATGPASR